MPGNDEWARGVTSVVISRLDEMHLVLSDEVHDAMLLSQATGPGSAGEVLQGFRLSQTLERVSQDVLYDVERPERDLPVIRHPEPEVFPKLVVENRETLRPGRLSSFRQDRGRVAASPPTATGSCR